MKVFPDPKPGKDHVKLKGAKYAKLKTQVLERDNYQCIECGTTQNLTLAHRIHKGMGGGKGPGDVIDNCDCKCMDCHDKEERHIDGRMKK